MDETTLPPKPKNSIEEIRVDRRPGIVRGSIGQNPFSVLQNTAELKSLFLTYPRLKSQLREIYSATLPVSDDQASARQFSGPYQQQFHKSYLDQYDNRGRGRGRIRGGHNGTVNKGPWTPDQGVQNGIDAFCRAREDDGKDGEGVREYADLVMKLVTYDGSDVEKMVHDEVAEDNARLIAQLLSGDS